MEGVGEIKGEGQRKRKRKKIRERDKQLNVGEEDWVGALGIRFSESHLSFFDEECLLPKEVLVL